MKKNNEEQVEQFYLGSQEEQFYLGFNAGDFAAAYETTCYKTAARAAYVEEEPQPYQDGFLLGFYATYEPDEIDRPQDRVRVMALRKRLSGVVDFD